MVRIIKAFTIEKECLEYLERKAKELGISKSDVLNMLIEQAMKENKP